MRIEYSTYWVHGRVEEPATAATILYPGGSNTFEVDECTIAISEYEARRIAEDRIRDNHASLKAGLVWVWCDIELIPEDQLMIAAGAPMLPGWDTA